MASDWNEELKKYERNRGFAGDLSDSMKSAAQVISFLVGKKKTSSLDRLKQEQQLRDEKLFGRGKHANWFSED
ncbi:hypothetical protein [Pantoea stewartii]|uniref:hypothetical protein n=1 Tax=Pantoea stewartii TaxID=66269 RepID=UPI00197F75CC|nr:hypothetical protein [Pantoea stewartii]